MKALITGASSGMGHYYALELAKRGYDLVLVARNVPKLEITKTEAQKIANVQVEILQCDLSQLDNAHKLIEQVKDETIDLVINNAGVGYFGDYLDQSLESIESISNVNMTSLALLTNYFNNKMTKENRAGIIINISSVTNFIHVYPGCALYAATKTFVDALSRAINYENKKRHSPVRVVTVRPGMIRTNWYGVAASESGKEIEASKKALNFKRFTKPQKFTNKVLNKVFKGKDVIDGGKFSFILKYISRLAPLRLRNKIYYRTSRKQK